MIMADIMRIFLIVVGLLIVIVSYWLLSEALFPGMVDRSRLRYSRSPFKTVLLGIVTAAAPVIGGIAMLNAPNPGLKFLGAVILLSTILIGLLGSAGLSRHIGQRLNSPADEAQPWRRVLRGGIVLSLTFVLPLIGWFLILPVTLISGFGAAVLSWREGKKSEPEAAAA